MFVNYHGTTWKAPRDLHLASFPSLTSSVIGFFVKSTEFRQSLNWPTGNRENFVLIPLLCAADVVALVSMPAVYISACLV